MKTSKPHPGALNATFQGVVESLPDAILIISRDGSIVYTNAQLEKLFGYSRGEIIGRPMEILLPQRLRGAHHARREVSFREPAVRAAPRGVDLFALRKDGSEFPIEAATSPLETESGLLLVGSIRDVTERKKAEHQRARLAAIVEASDDAIIGKDLNGAVTSWNHGAQLIFGYSEAEVIGKSISIIIPPGRESEEPAILLALAEGKTVRCDTVRRRKDGSDIDVSITSSPVRNSSGELIGISKVARDITDRKRAEDALADAKARAEDANQELEAFSYAVAHDLRAPLRGMNGFAQVLLDTYGDRFDAEGKDWLEEILLNAKKMASLIDALLGLSRVTRSEMHRESVDLSALMRATCERLAATDPHRVVELEIQDDVRAELDPHLARALIENLANNAWKFSSKTRVARIELGMVDGKEAREYFVRDNGAGFDMTFAKKLFSAFQRLHTNEEFPGTGIGLATVQRIIHRHGGRVWAEGVVDGGATFHFSIPSRESEKVR